MGNYKPSIKQYVVTVKAIKSSQFGRLGICAVVLLFVLGYPFYFISNNPFDTSIRYQYVDPYNDTTRKYTTIEKQHTDIGGNGTTILYPKNLQLDQKALLQLLNTTETTNPFVQYIGNSSSIAFSQLNQTLVNHSIQVFDPFSNSDRISLPGRVRALSDHASHLSEFDDEVCTSGRESSGHRRGNPGLLGQA